MRLKCEYAFRLTGNRGALAQLLHDGPDHGCDVFYSMHSDKELALTLARDSSVAGSAYGHTAMACMFEHGMRDQVRTNKKKALQHFTVLLPATSPRFIIILYFSSLGS